MKKVLALVLAMTMAFSFAACSKKAEDAQSGADTQVEQTAPSLWDAATYTEDVELGDADAKYTAKVTVTAEDKSIVATLHGEGETLGALLTETGLASGTVGEWGLYIDTVNGIVADYDATGAYWSFYIGEEYASVGVDGEAMVEGTVGEYTLAYEVYEG